jgi:parvulin-like peptidyl-prolyl isomerase
MSAKSGGDLGWVSKGKLSPALDDALFNKLQPGQISDVLKTEYGYHIVLCEAKQPAAVAPFSEVRDEILQVVLKDRQTDIISVTKALSQDLRRISSVAVYRENL